MEPGEMRRLVEAARVARLATISGDGRPRLVPCVFVLATSSEDRDTVYSAVDDKPKTTLDLARLADIDTNPAVALLVDEYDDDWSRLWWVRLRGRGRAVREEEGREERERALSLLAAKYPQYVQRRPEGPVLAIDVDEWRGWSAAG